MEEVVTYGVFYKLDDHCKWYLFSSWFPTYEDAQKEADKVLNNPLFVAAKIVERTETFEDVAEWDKE